MSLRVLTALPVFNEEGHVADVLKEVQKYSKEVLVVDDGSSDRTAEILKTIDGIYVVRHQQNQGYGAALRTAFTYALSGQYDVLVTIDCDGQHEPQRIGQLVAACRDGDIISGSRYLRNEAQAHRAPAERRVRRTASRRRSGDRGASTRASRRHPLHPGFARPRRRPTRRRPEQKCSRARCRCRFVDS